MAGDQQGHVLTAPALCQAYRRAGGAHPLRHLTLHTEADYPARQQAPKPGAPLQVPCARALREAA